MGNLSPPPGVIPPVTAKLKNGLLILLLLTTISGGVAAFRFYGDLQRLRLEHAGLADAERAGLRQRLWAAEKLKNSLAAELASLRASPGRARAQDGPPAGDDGPPGMGPRGDGFRGRGAAFAALRNDPEFVKLMTLQQKAGLDAHYAQLFKSLGQNLTPAQLDQFKNLLAEKQMAAMDVMTTAREQGLNPRDPDSREQIDQLMKQTQSQVDSQIQQTLSPSDFAQYQAYEQTMPERNTVNQLAQSLSYTGTPLQDSQLQQLIAVLAANAPASGQAGPGMGALLGRPAIITDADITAATPFLNPDQIKSMQQLQATQQAQRQMWQLMRNGGAATPR